MLCYNKPEAFGYMLNTFFNALETELCDFAGNTQTTPISNMSCYVLCACCFLVAAILAFVRNYLQDEPKR